MGRHGMDGFWIGSRSVISILRVGRWDIFGLAFFLLFVFVAGHSIG